MGTKLHAMQRYCPRQETNLLEHGQLAGGGTSLRCALHGYVFRLDTGAAANVRGTGIRVRRKPGPSPIGDESTK